jgi:hypothetical protein
MYEMEQAAVPTVDSPPRGGRRLKKASPDGQTTVSMRMPDSLRVRLEEAARNSDRNLSQECARRLRLSFESGGAGPVEGAP